jgi:hypothetical protein
VTGDAFSIAEYDVRVKSAQTTIVPFVDPRLAYVKTRQTEEVRDEQ